MRQTGNGESSLLPPDELPLSDAPAVHYKPGQQLTIPIAGGGTVYLKGEVYEQQPKIAFGVPLEPLSNHLAMRGAVLTSEGHVVTEFLNSGATADLGKAVTLGAGSEGTFLFALEPFPGAVQGQIEWGQMTFTVDGRPFHLVAAAPLTSGDQPRPVWVRHDRTPMQRESIGVVQLGNIGR